ncbi:protein of unknown function [Rhodovastum atsumiense]|nr:protein of unknown function [Rhodovastum atsumiense]
MEASPTQVVLNGTCRSCCRPSDIHHRPFARTGNESAWSRFVNSLLGNISNCICGGTSEDRSTPRYTIQKVEYLWAYNHQRRSTLLTPYLNSALIETGMVDLEKVGHAACAIAGSNEKPAGA